MTQQKQFYLWQEFREIKKKKFKEGALRLNFYINVEGGMYDGIVSVRLHICMPYMYHIHF